MNRYNYRRRHTVAAHAGNIGIGGDNPVRLQSMTNTVTTDTEASARQAVAIAAAGGELVRLTTQGEREAANMENIRRRVRELGVDVPLVADVHFNPKAAYRAASACEKVRINPGNFVDAARTFRKLEFTGEEYAAEQERIRRALIPLLDICRENDTCLRLGVNHGSLSDRIMSRYGDTPAGMTESAMEFLRVCRDEGFLNVVISIKASNTVVMVETVRLLVEAMDREDMHFPLHLGVTEAGDGEEGRIKSAVGIATLLSEGSGDTIRVSLSEPPENEIPVARIIRDRICRREGHITIPEPAKILDETGHFRCIPLPGIPSAQFPLSVHADLGEIPAAWVRIDASEEPDAAVAGPILLSSRHANPVGEMQSWIDRFILAGGRAPVVLRFDGSALSDEELPVAAAADLGTMLLNGYGAGILVDAPEADPQRLARMELAILQAARLRFSHTEYIACPGCGRTLFDLPNTLQEVRRATSHLTGLKIGVMGCIVNGPGEMADADYGYVGAGPGKVSIYKGKELKIKNIPTADALDALIGIIRENGDWQDP